MKQKILAYIERLKEKIGKASSDLYNFTERMRGELSALEDVKGFINSLPEEPPEDIVECEAKADLDSHGADYGTRKLIINLPDFTPEGTKYVVQIKKII